MTEEKPRPKCVKGKGFCGGMVNHLEDPGMRTRRGMMCLTLLDESKPRPEPKGSTPCYFSKKYKNGTWLNYCPWCGADFSLWNSPLTRKKEA